MNEFILFAMDDLANPSKHTQEQKKANRYASWDVAIIASKATTTSTYAAYRAAEAVGAVDTADAAFWVKHYFEITGEDKTTYINKLKGK